MMASTTCPYGLGLSYRACCGRSLDGGLLPQTAEQLMRSRYTAYALRREDYLRLTWHPSTCPQDLAGDPAIRWLGLEIRATTAGGPEDREGTVEFIARYKIGGRAHRLHERSRFVRLQDRWVYLDGDIGPMAADTRRKSPAPGT